MFKEFQSCYRDDDMDQQFYDAALSKANSFFDLSFVSIIWTQNPEESPKFEGYEKDYIISSYSGTYIGLLKRNQI